MVASDVRSAVTDLWNEQGVWSQAANRRKRVIGRVRAASLALGIAAAVVGTASSQLAAANEILAKVLACVAAAAAGLIPVVSGRAGPLQIQDWTRLRSASEAFKRDVYTFLAGVAPYRGDDALPVLLDRFDRTRREASDLLPHIAGVEVGNRGLPPVSGVDSYIELRLKNQIQDYYRPKARLMGRRLALTRRIEFALAASGAALGALSGAFAVVPAAAWVAVTSTVAAVLAAHSMAAKYEYQQLEFTRTATELEHLMRRRENAAGQDALGPDAFVERCEQVISVLNDTWMVKWNGE
ncbi:DUF4231 domain-containing protein [Streptomyces sp. SPB162]|uniref:DUF4231 domain-containing protein n=1 Tax=Streptomyces sp. SPB162 TaxID=2940560 RepID=UPI0024077042|nr:DUF4231 domain-containing protein [Streptomyces sp. SPB162]MDF9810794.1 hypothetical protein [Streptomyces sp. SPB162]